MLHNFSFFFLMCMFPHLDKDRVWLPRHGLCLSGPSSREESGLFTRHSSKLSFDARWGQTAYPIDK